MAVTVAQGDPVRSAAFSSTSTPNLAYSSAVTAGNTLVACICGASAQTIDSVADSLGQTWTKKVEHNSFTRMTWWYFKGTVAGTPTVTATLSGLSGGHVITLFELSSSTGKAIDVESDDSASSGSTNVADPGSIVTTLPDAIILVGTENQTTDSVAGTSYTLINAANAINFETCQYRIVTSTNTYSTAFGSAVIGQWTAAAVAFGESLAPTLTKVAPFFGRQGRAVSVTLTGTNFDQANPVINISGTGVTSSNLNVASATSITATFTISASAAFGDRTVSVTTDKGTSATFPFEVKGLNPALRLAT